MNAYQIALLAVPIGFLVALSCIKPTTAGREAARFYARYVLTVGCFVVFAYGFARLFEFLGNF